MSGASITAEPSPREAPPPDVPAGESRWRRLPSRLRSSRLPRPCSGSGSSTPRSGRSSAASSTDGNHFVWFANFKELFTTDLLLTAIKNNVLWVAIVPVS